MLYYLQIKIVSVMKDHIHITAKTSLVLDVIQIQLIANMTLQYAFIYGVEK